MGTAKWPKAAESPLFNLCKWFNIKLVFKFVTKMLKVATNGTFTILNVKTYGNTRCRHVQVWAKTCKEAKITVDFSKLLILHHKNE